MLIALRDACFSCLVSVEWTFGLLASVIDDRWTRVSFAQYVCPSTAPKLAFALRAERLSTVNLFRVGSWMGYLITGNSDDSVDSLELLMHPK